MRIDYILSHAEYIALILNIFMFAVFSFKNEWPRAIYWLGAVLVVVGVIWMNNGKQ